MINQLQFLIKRLRFLLKKILKRQSYSVGNGIQHILNSIEENGYAVVPNFYTNEECKLLRDEIDRVILKREKENRIWKDQYQADNRCFSAEVDSNEIAKYNSCRFLNVIADNYFKAKMTCSNTLASRITYKEGNVGSGQGWHRDGNQMQFKALIYLSDVANKDGPFQILRASHNFKKILKHIKLMGYDGLNTRFTDAQIKKVIIDKPADYKIIKGRAGTVLLFDSSTIHTGSPLAEGGVRYALTNYYMPSYEDVELQRNVFLNASNYIHEDYEI